MHSSSIISILSASALFTMAQAAPVAQSSDNSKRGLIYSKCTLPSGLAWDGYCSQDPCGMWQRWCVDYEEGTWTPKGSNPAPAPKPDIPAPAPAPQPPATGGAYYQCAASGFDGMCSHDPCDGNAWSWCRDYIWKSYTPAGSPVPAPAPNPAPAPVPQPPAPTPDQTCSAIETRFEPNAGNTCKFGLGINFYTCQNNGFKGCCSSDPCAKDWCPDYKQGCYNA